jgi:Cu/Ag efflux protein CusF
MFNNKKLVIFSIIGLMGQQNQGLAATPNYLMNSIVNSMMYSRAINSKPKLGGFGATFHGVVSKIKVKTENTTESLVAVINGQGTEQPKEKMTVTESNCGVIEIKDQHMIDKFKDGDRVRFKTSGGSCEITDMQLE